MLSYYAYNNIIIVMWPLVPLFLSFAEGEADVKGSPGEQDESLLDNRIKELESGIKGMADLTGAPAEVSNMNTLGIYMYVYMGWVSHVHYYYSPSSNPQSMNMM